MKHWRKAFLFAAVLLVPFSSAAQVVPIDTAEVMIGVMEALRAGGQAEDADRLLDLIRRRYPNSEAVRQATDVLADGTRQEKAGSGNTELIVWSTFYGATLGVLVPAAFGAETPEPYGAGILLGAPAGYGISKYYTKHYPVSTGQARAMTFGSWWGALQGLGWREVFDLGDHTETVCYGPPEDVQCFDFGTESGEAPYVAMIVGGLTGMTAGTILGRTLPISGSTALITNFSALWGSWFGTVLGVQLNQEETGEFGQDDDDALVTTILMAGNVGLLAGAVGGTSLGWSTGDAWTVHLSGIAGLIGGLGIDLLASVEDENTGFLIPGLTSAAALGIASTLVGGRDEHEISTQGPRTSVIDFASGRWRAGIPTPMPTAIPVFRNGKRSYEPGAQVSLVRMTW